MNKLFSSACAVLLALASTTCCLAADSPWSGTWKQDLAQSKLSGDTFTVTAKPGGAFHMDAGGIIQYDFACDGKPYTTLSDRTLTCTGSAAAGYDFTSTAKGTVLSKSHRTLSADGKTMTIHGTSMLPNGTTSTYDETYKRLTGTTGMVGKWLDVKDSNQVPSVSQWTVTGNAVHLEVPSLKEVIDAKLDGTPGTVTGPTIPAGAGVTLKAVSKTEVHFVDLLNGKVLSEGNFILSADGKTMTQQDWIPGHESEKETIVYVKQ